MDALVAPSRDQGLAGENICPVHTCVKQEFLFTLPLPPHQVAGGLAPAQAVTHIRTIGSKGRRRGCPREQADTHAPDSGATSPRGRTLEDRISEAFEEAMTLIADSS
jgi:hypothetical protein